MEPTSDSQFAGYRSKTPPPLEQIRPDVWAASMPMHGHIVYSYTYLLKDSDGAFHLIDPGWETDENWDRTVAALADLGSSVADIRSITSTHLHPDHVGLAERLRDASGAVVQLHSIEQHAMETRGEHRTPAAVTARLQSWGVPAERLDEFGIVARESSDALALKADHLLEDGDRLQIPGFDLMVMLTPGHTAGHICLRDDQRELLYSGDHVIPTMHAGLGLGGLTETNPLADYLESLETVSEFTDYEVLPGHGYRFIGIAERAAQSAEHHLKRSREVTAILTANPEATVWKTAAGVSWTAGWKNLHGFFLYSALQQTEMHAVYARQRMLA